MPMAILSPWERPVPLLLDGRLDDDDANDECVVAWFVAEEETVLLVREALELAEEAAESEAMKTESVD